MQTQSRIKVSGLAADITPMSAISSLGPSVSLTSAFGTGLTAIATGNQQLNADAEQIADPLNQNLINPLVDLSQSSLLSEAGAEVIRASNDMLGTLFDAFA
jgi:hypothetical protein